MAVALTLCSI